MIHTPAMSDAFLTLINTLSPIKFEDISYSNDCSDSIWNNDLSMQIFLPNRTNPFNMPDHGEDLLGFNVCFDYNTDNLGNIYINHTFTLIELIHFLYAQQWQFDIDGHTEVTFTELIINESKDEAIDFEEFVKPYLDMEVEDQHLFPNELDGQITVTRIS